MCCFRVVFCITLHTLVFAYSLHADARVFFFLYYTKLLFLVVLCLCHYWCLFVDPLCICVLFVSLWSVFVLVVVCVYLRYLPSPVVLSFLFDVDLKMSPGVSRVSWRAGLDFLRVLRLPTTVVSVWCVCKVDQTFQDTEQKDVWKVLRVITKSRKASDEVIWCIQSVSVRNARLGSTRLLASPFPLVHVHNKHGLKLEIIRLYVQDQAVRAAGENLAWVAALDLKLWKEARK